MSMSMECCCAIIIGIGGVGVIYIWFLMGHCAH